MGNFTTNPSADTILTCVQHSVETFPNRELFVFYNGKIRDAYTCKQLFQLAGKFAYRLRHKYGFKRNDVIANTLPNSPERLVTSLGVTMAGCIDMNGQILLADGDDFFESAKISRCNGVILTPDGNSSAWRLMKPHVTGDSSSDVVQLSCDRAPELVSGILVSRQNEGRRKALLEDLRSSNEDIFVAQDVVPDDVLTIFTTSGSTGYSKLVPRTHKEILEMWNASMNNLRDKHNFTEDDGFYNDRPLGWLGGYPFGSYINGDKRVLLDSFTKGELRSGEEMWRAISSENCRSAVILPLDLDKIVMHVTNQGETPNKFEMLGVGGQPITQAQIRRAFVLTKELFLGYGSTEAALIVNAVITDPEATVKDFFCGKTAKRISLRILDDKGKECKPGELGTIFIKGLGIFKGYFNRLENPDPKTAEAFTEDGYFNTEDNGYIDEDGNVYVIGRNKDTIMHGSSVLYPGWMEAKLAAHSEISVACILPVSDPVLHHAICACVKPAAGVKLTEEKVKSYCEKMFLADATDEFTPVPKFYMIMDDIPQTATGKPDKQKLRRLAEEKFGSKEKSSKY